MSKDQCMERAEVCFAMAAAHHAVTPRKASMDQACWLWLFVWTGMFGCA